MICSSWVASVIQVTNSNAQLVWGILIYRQAASSAFLLSIQKCLELYCLFHYQALCCCVFSTNSQTFERFRCPIPLSFHQISLRKKHYSFRIYSIYPRSNIYIVPGLHLSSAHNMSNFVLAPDFWLWFCKQVTKKWAHMNPTALKPC